MQVRYEEIVDEYERGLQTRLRGFRPAHDFLDTWVHDPDPARSILSMLEAAELGGIKDLDIAIGPETAGRMDRQRLQELAAQVGKVTLEEQGAGLLLKVTYE